MLVCRACNTRFGERMRTCPSCGRRASGSAETVAGDSGPLPPGPSQQANDEIDLDEDSVVGGRAKGGQVAPEPEKPKPSAPPTPAAGGAPLDTDPDQVKTLLAQQPGLLEKGLGVYANEEGEPLGADFDTPVGSIDLLCRDRKGGFVLVHLPEPDEIADSVSAMLRCMGWVRKHLAGSGEEVRGVVVVDQLPEELAYAAAGAAGAISFKACRLSLSFHDIDG